MNKYYDMPNLKMVTILEWKDGFLSLEGAKKYFLDEDIREITKDEYDVLKKKYSNKKIS